MIQPEIFRDYMGGYNSEDEPTQSGMRILAYDEEHFDAWMKLISDPAGARNHTIITLQNVSADSVPIRWLGTIAEAAQTWEQLDAAGIQPPTSWKLLAPLHINSACNEGDAEGALNQAQKLLTFTAAYLARFHPGVPIPELEVDDPAWVIELMEHGAQLYPHLPGHVRDTLSSMAAKHDSGNSTNAQVTSSYLLAHYEVYGRLNGKSFGGFAKRENAIFIVPQSEHTFHDLMDSSESAMRLVGIRPVPMIENGNILMVSSGLRSPHYYPHKGEPDLGSLNDRQRWPTVNQLSHRGINGRALKEIVDTVMYIESDIGGKSHIGELTEMIGECLL